MTSLLWLAGPPRSRSPLSPLATRVLSLGRPDGDNVRAT